MSSNKPTVFLAGAPKAGTSAMGVFLARHPQICMCAIKEPNFFCDDFDMPGPKTELEYLDLFSPTSDKQLLLDASILYLYSRNAARAIKNYVKYPKIIVLLRDPVEAMYSWHSQMVFTANEPIHDFKEAIDAEIDRKQGRRLPTVGSASRCPELLYYSDIMSYANQIKRYLKVFDRSQLHIISYDEFVCNQGNVYAQTLEFLSLDTTFKANFDKVNAGKERKSWRLHYILKQLFAKPSKTLLSPKTRLRLINILDKYNSKKVTRQPMDEALRAQLTEACRPDIIQLSELLNRDFSHWCNNID